MKEPGCENVKRKNDLTGRFEGKKISTEERIREYLSENGSATRKEIVSGTGIKWSTAFDALKRMLIKGKVRREERKKGHGRPPVYWKLKATR